MSKATEDALDYLHKLTAEELARVIKEGIPVTDRETGAVHMAPAPAAYIAAAIKFLKDNDIKASPDADRFGGLRASVADLPDFDEDHLN